MSNHHHHGHHHETQRSEGNRYAQPFPDSPVQSYSANYAYAGQEHKHKKHEHMAELGALGAGAFAMYKAHEVKVDPGHARRHRIEESIAGASAVGLGGYALHEHQKLQHDHKLEAAAYPPGQHEHHKNHHHSFFK